MELFSTCEPASANDDVPRDPSQTSTSIFSSTRDHSEKSQSSSNRNHQVKEEFKLLRNYAEQLLVSPGREQSAKLTLLDGVAEIFGYNLVQNILYEFAFPQEALLVSREGATVTVEYVKDCDTVRQVPSDGFFEKLGCVHSVLREHRKQSHLTNGNVSGPKVLIVGPTNSGKSTSCRTLLNFASNEGSYPTFVDLDPGQQGVALPGVLSSVVLSEAVDPVKAFSNAIWLYELPFGRIRINDDVALYRDQISNLATVVLKNLLTYPQLHSDGLIINTSGWIDGDGLDALFHAAEVFGVNTVVVLENPRLYKQFRKFSQSREKILEILYMEKPKHVSPPTTDGAQQYRHSLFLRAFFPNNLPASVVRIDLKKLTFYLVSSFRRVPMQNGSERMFCNEVLCPKPFLLNQLLYVSSASSVECDVKTFPIKGYAVLVGFDSVTGESWLCTTLDEASLTLPAVLLYTDMTAVGLRGLNFSDCLNEDICSSE